MSLPGRDAAAIEALVTDRYLDALLALGEGGAATDGSFPGAHGDGRRRTPLDQAVRLASDRLARDLPRFHPSFRFEERLAVRLAEAAAAMRAPAAVGAEGSIVALPVGRRPGQGHGPADTAELAALLDDEPDGLARIPRPLLVGGAVAASAISLAGAAWMAWRRSRAATPMGRAARTAHALQAQGERAGTLGTGR